MNKAFNPWGIFCEEFLREILAEAGIPHKKEGLGDTYYWWASRFEDERLGVDCWVKLPGQKEIPVDFTVISSRKPGLLRQKVNNCLGRGVIPVVLEAGILWRAVEGHSGRLLDAVGQEIRLQIHTKRNLLKVPPIIRRKWYPQSIIRSISS